LYIPNIVTIVGLAHWMWRMPLPARPVSFFVFLSLGVLAFRAVGLIVAAVANSVGESNILVQLFYMPMMFLSGATIPIAVLPAWAQVIATFIPAYYLVNGIQGIFQRQETLLENAAPIGALLVTLVLSTFVARQ